MLNLTGTTQTLLFLSALAMSGVITPISIARAASLTTGDLTQTSTTPLDSVTTVAGGTTPSPTPTATTTYNRTASTVTTDLINSQQNILDSIIGNNPNTNPVNTTSVPMTLNYHPLNSQDYAQVFNCFSTGNCKDTTLTTGGANTLLRYPIRCNGSGTADCTGCYIISGGRLTRVSDVNPSNGECLSDSTVSSANGGQNAPQKIKIFVGYQMRCPNGAGSDGTCNDGELYLNCKISGLSASTFEQNSLGQYERECFANSPYIRRQPASTVANGGTPTCTATCTALAGAYCSNQSFYDGCGHFCAVGTGTLPPSSCGG